MSFTNSTTNYGLPQWLGTDKPSYLNDQNGAYETIDTTMKANETAASNAMSKATANEEAITGLDGRLDTAEGTISSQGNTLEQMAGIITNLTNDVRKATKVQSGDIFNWPLLSGHITSGGKQIYLGVQLPKKVEGTHAFNVTALSGVFRSGNGKYINGSSSVNYVNDPDTTIAVINVSSYGLIIRLTYAGEYFPGDYVNNATVDFQGSVELTVTT